MEQCRNVEEEIVRGITHSNKIFNFQQNVLFILSQTRNTTRTEHTMQFYTSKIVKYLHTSLYD